MKARNHTIACHDLAQFERLEDEYTWLGENFEVNRDRLTITLLARPRLASRDAAVRRQRADETSDALTEAYYAERYS